jgi:hypothetical protein
MMLRARLLSILAGAIWLAFMAPLADAANLFAILDTGELYVSSTHGVTWVGQGTLPVRDAVGLAAGATSSDLFLATRSGSVYRSTDAGNSWAGVGAIAASDIAGFAIGPFGAVLALTRSGTVYSSSNQGASFTPVASLAASDWVSLARGPQARLYALAETGQVAESKDQGSTWSTVGVLTVSNAVAIRRLGNDLYVLTKTGEVYRSINYGSTWTPVGTLTSSSMGALVDVGNTLVAAAREGEVATSANGAAWTWVGAINQLSVIALATDTPMVTGVAEESAVPRFVVRAPFPNPSTSAAGAVFSLWVEGPEQVAVTLHDAQGRLIAARPREALATAGDHVFRWAPANLPAGTYFVRFETSSGRTAVTKWTVVR